MNWLYDFFAGPLNTVAWIYILLPCVFIGGLYFTSGTGAVQFRRFGYAMKNTLGKMFTKMVRYSDTRKFTSPAGPIPRFRYKFRQTRF